MELGFLRFSNFGHGELLAWGAYIALSAVGCLAAMVMSGVAGLIVGTAALRLRHDYLAITTFGIAVVVQLVALNAQWLTGGPFGVQFIPKPWQGALGTGVTWNLAYLALVAGLLLLLYLGLERLVRSPWGRVLRAIREDEEAAASLGKSACRFRLQSFVIGSMSMGLGGALYAHFVGCDSGNSRGAILGACLVWGFWALSGGLLRNDVPQAEQARAAALQVVLIGVLIARMLLWRPRGFRQIEEPHSWAPVAQAMGFLRRVEGSCSRCTRTVLLTSKSRAGGENGQREATHSPYTGDSIGSFRHGHWR